MINVNQTTIDTCLWNIERHLIEKYGCDQAARDMQPLKYYINTGRASTEFLYKLLNAKPFMLARKLHKGGSDLEVVTRVKGYIGFTE